MLLKFRSLPARIVKEERCLVAMKGLLTTPPTALFGTPYTLFPNPVPHLDPTETTLFAKVTVPDSCPSTWSAAPILKDDLSSHVYRIVRSSNPYCTPSAFGGVEEDVAVPFAGPTVEGFGEAPQVFLAFPPDGAYELVKLEARAEGDVGFDGTFGVEGGVKDANSTLSGVGAGVRVGVKRNVVGIEAS